MKDRMVSSLPVAQWYLVFFIFSLLFQAFVLQFDCGVIDIVIVCIGLPAILTFALMQRHQQVDTQSE